MASAQNPTQDPQTNVVHHNHIVIKYQQPPDPAIINYVLEILIVLYPDSWHLYGCGYCI